MKHSILSLCTALFLTGCISNAADKAVPAPTNLTGFYKASFLGGSVSWKINADGTGVACEERTSLNHQPKIRDMVVNGTKAFDVYEFEISDVSSDGFKANGFVDFTFKAIKHFPTACKI